MAENFLTVSFSRNTVLRDVSKLNGVKLVCKTMLCKKAYHSKVSVAKCDPFFIKESDK
jgi:hypothetical protein